MFFSITDFNSRCLLICDDFYALAMVKGLIGIIANFSRKLDLDMILTCQYYTMIEKSIRQLTQIVDVNYIEGLDILRIGFLNSNSNANNFIYDSFYEVKHSVKIAKEYYDTNEIVVFPLPSKIESEILKFSNNSEDLEQNCFMLYPTNETKRLKLYNRLLKNSKFS